MQTIVMCNVHFSWDGFAKQHQTLFIRRRDVRDNELRLLWEGPATGSTSDDSGVTGVYSNQKFNTHVVYKHTFHILYI